MTLLTGKRADAEEVTAVRQPAERGALDELRARDPGSTWALGAASLEALVAGDLDDRFALAGVELTPYLVDERWLWRIRLDQVGHGPVCLDWIARAAVDAEHR